MLASRDTTRARAHLRSAVSSAMRAPMPAPASDSRVSSSAVLAVRERWYARTSAYSTANVDMGARADEAPASGKRRSSALVRRVDAVNDDMPAEAAGGLRGQARGEGVGRHMAEPPGGREVARTKQGQNTAPHF